MTPQAFIEVLRKPLAELPHELEMVPLPGRFDVTLRPPGSKSITNRVLLLAALAEGESEITGALLDADDARVMIEALRSLGVGVEIDEGRPIAAAPGSFKPESSPNEPGAAATGPTIRIKGAGGRFKGNRTINLKNAGTATRFLTAAACLSDGPVVIDGNDRMRQRPIGELVGMLRSLGITVDELGAPGCVPLRVQPGRFTKSEIEVGVTQSSQFISALMLVAPLMEKGLVFRFGPSVTSPSYIDLTVSMLSSMYVEGAIIPTGDDPDSTVVNQIEDELEDAPDEIDGRRGVPRERPPRSIHIEPARVVGFRYEVEPDASGMTYFWGAASIVPGAVLRGDLLGFDSIQGDSAFREVLLPPEQSGCVISYEPDFTGPAALWVPDADLTNMPDAAMTLAAVACFDTSGQTTTITGLRTLRVKETDRLAAIRNELTKVGAHVEIFQIPDPAGIGPTEEGLRIGVPPGGLDCSPAAPRVVFDTYDDHRMAMSLALIGLRRPNVVIRDPQCVAKTYPTFWRDLSLLYESAVRGGEHIGQG
jgi:3-phosphoshikimate 1-carboxyvinyltransferase